jgi:hypothetical protein
MVAPFQKVDTGKEKYWAQYPNEEGILLYDQYGHIYIFSISIISHMLYNVFRIWKQARALSCLHNNNDI